VLKELLYMPRVVHDAVEQVAFTAAIDKGYGVFLYLAEYFIPQIPAYIRAELDASAFVYELENKLHRDKKEEKQNNGRHQQCTAGFFNEDFIDKIALHKGIAYV